MNFFSYLWDFFVHRNTGFVFDKSDDRDFVYSDSFISGVVDDVIINDFSLVIRNQGGTNACTGFSSSYLFDILLNKLGSYNVDVGPEFTWFVSRLLEGTEKKNVGVSLRNTLKSVFSFGVVEEKHWRFISKNHYSFPPVSVFNIAVIFRELIIKTKMRYFNMLPSNVDACLRDGFPVVAGVLINNSFYGNRDGVIGSDEPLNSSHAILLTDKVLIGENYYYKFANSWGAGWGDNGWGYIPVDYFVANSHNIWSIRFKED